MRADGCGSRSIIIGGRSTYTGKGYVQYEIIGGGAGARATKDGASGTTVNQSNAKIAPIEIIESEFPTRVLRFELIRDSGGAGEFSRRARHPARISQSRRRALLDPLDEARHSAERLRRRRHRPAPATSGSIPGSDQAKRLPTRYADYPLKEGDIFRLDTPGGGGYGDPLARPASACSTMCAKAMCRRRRPSATTVSC